MPSRQSPVWGSWGQWTAWKIDTVLSGPPRELLPPHPGDDPAYWEMNAIVREAWQQTIAEALAGNGPLDFEADFLARSTDAVENGDLTDAGRQAAEKEIYRRLTARRTVLRNVRLFEGRSPDRGHLRQLNMMWRHVDAGLIQYEICPARGHGWLGKINIELDYLRGGLGRRGLNYLTTRYPKATWTTSTQMSGARGFWTTMQNKETGGWSPRGGSCCHGWDTLRH